jgi:hypothetical protein
MEAAIPQRCPSQYAKQLEAPITYEEITTAIKTGARHKAPGTDGISLEFYTQNWDTIKAELKELLNQMLSHNKVSAKQKHAIIETSQKQMENQPQKDTDQYPYSSQNTKSWPESWHSGCAQ